MHCTPQGHSDRSRAVTVLIAAWLLIALGVSLRAVQYAANRSLWTDEAKLVLNILERPLSRLHEPLNHAQVAPHGFLVVEKLATGAFGTGEAALRLVPFAAGVVSVWLFWVLARRLLTAPAALFALALFATNDALIYYAAEAKQYSSDVLVAVLIVLAAERIGRAGATGRRVIMLAVTGVIGLWFSHTAVLICAGVGVALLIDARRRGRGTLASMMIVSGIWVVCFLVAYRLVPPDPSGRDYLTGFWAKTFMPLWPRTTDQWLWYPRTLFGVFDDPLGLGAPLLGLAVFVGGCICLWRRDRLTLGLLMWPTIFALMVSAMHLYPFATNAQIPQYASDPRLAHPVHGRFVLYAVALWITVLAAAVGSLWSSRSVSAKLAAAVLAVAVLVQPVAVAAKHAWSPPDVQDVRAVVADVKSRYRDGDLVIVQKFGHFVTDYYMHRMRWQPKIALARYVTRDDLENWLPAVAAAPPGRRIWLISTRHPRWPDQIIEQEDIEAVISQFADTQLRLRHHNASAKLFVRRRLPRSD